MPNMLFLPHTLKIEQIAIMQFSFRYNLTVTSFLDVFLEIEKESPCFTEDYKKYQLCIISHIK